jgi:hypothetical protein
MATIVGSITGPEFGITAETAIILDDIEETAGSDVEDFEDADNDVVLSAIMPRPRELTCSYRVKTPASMPAESLRGNTITFQDSRFSGTAWVVTEVGKSKSARGWLSGKLTARFDTGWTTSN